MFATNRTEFCHYRPGQFSPPSPLWRICFSLDFNFFCLGSFIVRFSLLFLPFSFFTPTLSFFLPLYVLFCGCDTHCLALLCSWFPSKHIDSPRSPTLPTHPSLSTPSFSPLSLAIAFVPLPGDTLQRVLHGGGQFYVSYGEPVPQHVGDSFFIPKGKPHAFDGQLHGPFGSRLLGGFDAWADVADGSPRRRGDAGPVDCKSHGQAGTADGLDVAPRVGMNPQISGTKRP